MALEKIAKTTLFQRLGNFIIGSVRPNLLTRVSVISGGIIWLYLFVWHLMSFVSTMLIDNIHMSLKIRAGFSKVGSTTYGLTDTINSLRMHSLTQIIIYLVILTSLILIWRKLKIGFLIYVVANVASLFITMLMLGWSYLIHEIPIFDYILIGITTLYFSIGIFMFYRKSKEDL